jgi:hypothetical protein
VNLFASYKKTAVHYIEMAADTTIYQSAKRQKQPVPRHNEIDDMLVKHIKKQLGL